MVAVPLKRENAQFLRGSELHTVEHAVRAGFLSVPEGPRTVGTLTQLGGLEALTWIYINLPFFRNKSVQETVLSNVRCNNSLNGAP